MAEEIAEQPEAVRRTLAALVPHRAADRGLFRGRRRVLFVARGSSDNAAVYGRYLLETHAGCGRVAWRRRASQRTTAPGSTSPTRSWSASPSPGRPRRSSRPRPGRADCGAATVAVANVADSPLVAAADLALVTQAGPEVAVPATKTYLAQLVAMAVLGTALAPDPLALDTDLDRVAGEVERLLAPARASTRRSRPCARRRTPSSRGVAC
jgi:glucosamine--fructose-6-phosphate aminotransferase (isomerizing)